MVHLIGALTLLPLGLLIVAADPIHVPLRRRSIHKLDLNEVARRVKVRYGFEDPAVSKGRRASTVSVPVTNQDGDASFFATMTVGTPPQTLGVILDTGSADLWFAGTSCLQDCQEVQLFESAKSSSFQGGNTNGVGSEVVIQYGSGAVRGALSQDTVSMGGFTVSNQKFLTVDAINGVILDSDPLGPSGLMGLAFAALAKTQATPFWEALVNSNQFSSPEMAFWLARSNNLQVQDVPGGAFTLGGTNSSLFTGDIEFINMPTGTPLFWTLTLSSVTINGKTVPISSDTTSAAIDTGTSLIAGPTADVTAIWATVPGSGPSPSGQGFFNFPCKTSVEVSISFGGKSWPISTTDIIAGQEPGESSLCIGAIFAVDVPANTANPSWIFGDTFLKNVYSVFRATPPSVGFAQLSSLAGGTGTGPASTSGSSAPIPTVFSTFNPSTFTGLPTISSPSSTGVANPGTSGTTSDNPVASGAIRVVQIPTTLSGALLTGLVFVLMLAL
ncbi:acid protease [Pholiota conissans]|uniref:Acid protease n=1 Tax=Pholiota conissans TaxID=109636 RepID=A0A9P5YR44_9AGAR|nr:acid protease [Pholiota conissans]